MKKYATTIVLFVLAAALGVWLWTQRDTVSVGERKRRENSAFEVWRREELSRVEIQHEGETIVLEREARKDAPWRMTSPRADRCDQASVERLLTTLEFASVKRRPTDDPSLLGLASPRARGTVTMGGLVLRFALGAPSPRPEGSAYFRVGDEAPVVVGREVVDALLASSDTLRDRGVVPYLSLDLARFEVQRAGGGFLLARSDARSFRVGEIGPLASREAVDRLWAALADMRAEAFPKDADADRLTQNARIRVVMTPKDPAKPPAELAVGDACPGLPDDVVVLRTKPTRAAACAPRSAIDALSVDPPALVELHPFTLHADEIEELRLEAGDRKIEIARHGAGFHEREPKDRQLDAGEADAARALLERIASSRAKALLAPSSAWGATGTARVRAGDHEEIVELVTMVIPQPEPPHPSLPQPVALRRTTDGAILDVDPLVRRLLTPRDSTLQPLALVADRRRVTRVLLRCGMPQELVDQGHGFELVEPKGLPADGSITQLVDGLVRGKVDLWVADSRDGFPLGDDACRVVLGFEDGNAPATVRFDGDAPGGGAYGSLDGDNHVFVANPGLRELAHGIYVSHAATREPIESIASVRVLERGKDVTPKDPDAAKDAASALFADRAVLVKKHDQPADVVVELARAAGAPKRVTCGPAHDGKRLCTASDLPLVQYELADAKLAPLLSLARDAGAH